MLSPEPGCEDMNPTSRSVCSQVLKISAVFLHGNGKRTPEVSDPSDTRKILINKIVAIKSV